MHLLLPSLPFVFLAQRSYSQIIGNSAVLKGVPPTASGQIGVNPVTDLGPEIYENLGPNTQWYKPEGGTTKWIGVNTEYLTDLPYTTTVNNQPTITQAPAAVVAYTAPADKESLKAGDVSFAFSPKLLEICNKLFTEAQVACSGLKKRESCSIDQRFAQRVAEEANPGGLLDFVGAEVRALLPVVSAPDVAAIAGPALAASPLVGVLVTWMIYGKLQAWTLPSSYINAGAGEDDSKCPSDAPTGIDAPLCSSDDCKGDEIKPDHKCTVGKYKGCGCLITGGIVGAYDTDETKYDEDKIWLDVQQKLLQDFVDESKKSPYCYHGASPRGNRTPKEYCNCGDDNRKTLTYSVASSTASPYKPCPYTTNDGPTVSFKTDTPAAAKPTSTPVVTCASNQERWFSSSDAFEWVNQFCNHKDGRLLKLRPAGLDLVDAQSQVFNNNKDPHIRIYAYLDDACSEKKTMVMNVEECAQALDAIIHDCDKDTEDKKMGGSVAINCQWFNIAAIKGAGNPTCNGIPSENSC